MAIFDVPSIVTKVASLDLTGPVRPIGQDTYKGAPQERQAIHARLTELCEAGTTGTTEFRRLVDRLATLNA